jgi:hypothetical protein
MRNRVTGMLALGAVAVLAAAAASQPPRDKGPGGGRKDGPPDGPPPGGRPGRFEAGRLLPPPLRDELDLTDEQQEQLARLERETKDRLLKILTPEQRKKLQEGRPRGPRGPGGPPDGPGGRRRGAGGGDAPPGREGKRTPPPPPDEDGGPPERGRRPERPDRPEPPPPPERPDRDEARGASEAGGIQWFATWESGLREAKRTGRPILLVSAAPHCAGVPGVW